MKGYHPTGEKTSKGLIPPNKTKYNVQKDKMELELEDAKKECDFIRKDYYDYIVYGCSNCDEEWFFENGTPKENEYNYCPKCGAKIKEILELLEEEED